MRRYVALLALSLSAAAAQADVSGQLRPQWQQRDANSGGPLAAAEALLPGIAPPPRSAAAIEAELRAQQGPLTGALYLQHSRPEGGPASSRASVQELYASGEWAGWQFSAGRKLVAWDVGFAFRPNDVVAQEERHTLLSPMTRGRPLVQAEYFTAETAWSLVWVNPQAGREARSGDEQALTLRVYQRQGAVDLHGFARLGEGTGASVGMAVSSVLGDSLELHGSARALQHSDVWRMRPITGLLASSSPWQLQRDGAATQALIGGSWTGENKLSLMLEAWWDGRAPSDSQWNDWQARNAALLALAGRAPAAAVAGNLAWQAQGFGNASLRRRNAFARLAWTHEDWQTSVDMLWTPGDGGRITSASLGWNGNRWHLDAGLRHYGGSPGSVIAQLPTRRVAYLAATCSF